MQSWRRHTLAALLALTAFSLPVTAEVVQVVVESREPFAGGAEFGDVGPYEVVTGRLHYAVDPGHAANTRIVDIQYAPLEPDGRVHFSGDFCLLKPLDLTRGNHRLFYDVNNRGNKVALGNHNGAWGNLPAPGNGFLMEQGYSILWSGWNWDVRTGHGRMQVELPVASEDGKAIEQQIAAEMVLSFQKHKAKYQKVCWGNCRGYPALDPSDDSAAVLSVRDQPQESRRGGTARGSRTVIPRQSWRFARVEQWQVVPDPTFVYLESGFEPGRIYELVYKVREPRVVGLGMAAVRDAISFFRFAVADSSGRVNPLTLVKPDGTYRPDAEKAYIYGSSQSGRFITHMIWQGFHVDEAGRMVFDGARIHIAGGGKGGFNHRFAQTTHHPSHLEGNYMPADHPPFNYLADGDPGSGAANDILRVAKELGRIPLIVIDNNELEYWTRSASLVHTSLDATRDASLHDNVRLYVASGAPHRSVASRARGVHEHSLNTIDTSPLLRALLMVLDRWASDGIEPPPSRYPRIDQGQMVTAAEHQRSYPAVPGMRHSGANLQPPRVDYGPRFLSEGVMTVVPPRMGEPYPTLVPTFDGDGNSVGGVRLPDVAVPLGTYQGWNLRHEKYGAASFLGRFDGSFWAFPVTRDQARQNQDGRASVEQRYATQDVYVAKVEEKAQELVRERFLLPADAAEYVRSAQQLLWPPSPVDEHPFWRTRDTVVEQPMPAAPTGEAPTPGQLTAAAVVARARQAQGAAALARIQTVKTSGSLAIPAAGVAGEIVVLQRRPGQALLTTKIMGTETSRITDGRTCWTVNPAAGGAVLDPPQVCRELLRDSSIDGPLQGIGTSGSQIELVGSAAVDGSNTHHVQVTYPDGGKQELFFDVETGLLRRIVSRSQAPDGNRYDITATLSDYRLVAGALFPHHIVQAQPGVEIVVDYQSIETGVEIDPTLFAAPDPARSAASPVAPARSDSEAIKAEVKTYLEQVTEAKGIPGLAVAITNQDEVFYLDAFGVRNVKSGEPLRPEHFFHLASVAKTVVATALLQLVEKGVVDLDATVTTYLPYFALEDPRHRDITVRQMLNHTSGMPDVLDYEWDQPQYDPGAAERYVRSRKHEQLVAAPGEAFRYSNMAFDILGDLVAKVAGTSFEDYVEKNIFEPIGMLNSTFVYPDVPVHLRTTPHVGEDGPVVSEVYPYNRCHAPSSTLNSSVVEMTHWIRVNRNRGVFNGSRILEEASFSLLWTPTTSAGLTTSVGLSWFLGRHRGERTVSHSGGDRGYRSQLTLLPDTGWGLILASNYQQTPIAEIRNGVLDILLGHGSPP